MAVMELKASTSPVRDSLSPTARAPSLPMTSEEEVFSTNMLELPSLTTKPLSVTAITWHSEILASPSAVSSRAFVTETSPTPAKRSTLCFTVISVCGIVDAPITTIFPSRSLRSVFCATDNVMSIVPLPLLGSIESQSSVTSASHLPSA